MKKSIMKCKNDSEPAGEQMTLFSLAGSLDHANRTAQPESGSERKTSDTCGPKCLESFERFNHVGSWAKTFSALLIGTGDWFSTRCKLTWKLKGTKSNRLYFQLQASTLPTKETGFGLLLTPTTRKEVMDLDKFKKRMEKYPNGTTMPNLATQVMGLLKTPCAADAYTENLSKKEQKFGNSGTLAQEIQSGFVEKRWPGLLPTPTTRDYKGARSTEALENSGRNHTNSLPDSFIQTGKTSQLNPQFVLEMMGFPPNWTELPFLSGETNQSKQGETQSCPK
jgi:hypothetical protein